LYPRNEARPDRRALITVVPLKNNITRDMREHADEVRDFEEMAW
jgi:hypothetical protein